jgi:large subunit ribosomal protein L18
MNETMRKQIRRLRRKRHVRKNVTGTGDRPRLTVFRSHKNIYAQIVDDMVGRTLVAASTMDKPLCEQLRTGGDKAAAQAVGSALAQKAVQAGIRKVVFDRNGFPYHGRVRELAEAARKGGLEF